MLVKVAAFEFRYQIKSPLFIVAAALFFSGAFLDMTLYKLLVVGGGNVMLNSPHSIIVSHLLVSLLFLFVGAAFVSNVIVRDDQTGFGPLIRATRITKFDYLFGRFIGAFAVSALIVAAVTFGAWLGTLMPFADQEMLGPNRLSGFAYGYGLFALPNALIICAILFAFATITRSTAGTFIGVICLFALYLVSQGLVASETQLVRALADPFGTMAYMAASRYFTAAELNAGLVPVTDLILQSRLFWIGISIALLGLTYSLFRFSDRGMSQRQQRKLKRQDAMAAAPYAADSGIQFARLAEPLFNSRTALNQFIARTAMEVRYILKSPAYPILLLIALVLTFVGLSTASGFLGGGLRQFTFVSIPTVQGSFSIILTIIATYYGGELIWRERERKVHEIIDATPLPAWALMLPKMLGLAVVMFTTLFVGMVVGLFVQMMDGSPDVGGYLRWYLLPSAVDAILIAVLAVFVAALSPNKYAGWGVMLLYILLLIFGPSLGLEYPLSLYGRAPPLPLSDMTGTGNYKEAVLWFQLFWAATAALLLVAVHLLWPRGIQEPLPMRLRQLPSRLSAGTRVATVAALTVVLLSGSWIVYNTLILNDFHTPPDSQRHIAEYERRYFQYAGLPQPTVRHIKLNVALYPAEIRAEVRGQYRLVNETQSPIEQLHVRVMDPNLELLDLELSNARLEQNDEEFAYRIYRLDTPMQPGEARSLDFRTRRKQVGFRAAGTETAITPNGTDLNTLQLTPRIGMSDVGLIEEPATRRKYGLPPQRPLPRLGDMAATKSTPSGDLSWTTADITVSTTAGQTPIAPGKKVSERVHNGRRIARFVPDAPIKNFFPIQSGRYAVRELSHDGVKYAIYYHPSHHWNVDRMMTAMRASIDYYSQAFGPYQFDHVRIIERPGEGGGRAFPGTLMVGEEIFALDLRHSNAFDAVTMLVAHEFAHQWWGHQVLGARMQGASLLYETLSQYSALMVTKKLRGKENIREFLQFQLDRYRTGRRTQVLMEEPLVSSEPSQDYIAYGKGAHVLYLLQQRMGEEAVNRALRRFVDTYRFTVAPYPRSLDLVRMLREEAKTPELQALVTDIFERITLYDLKVEAPTAVRRADGKWDVTVPVEAKKFYADGKGAESEARLTEKIEVGLFTAEPGAGGFDRSDVIRLQRRPIRSGKQVLKFVTDSKPTYAGVDPYNFYIDRNSADNVLPVT